MPSTRRVNAGGCVTFYDFYGLSFGLDVEIRPYGPGTEIRSAILRGLESC